MEIGNERMERRGNRLLIKAGLVAALVLLLLIPAQMIRGLVNERRGRQLEAQAEVSGKWAEAQTIIGPVISIPYNVYSRDTGNRLIVSREWIKVLPDELKISGKISPEKRRRGIYDVVVYKAQLQISGAFSKLRGAMLNIPAEYIQYKEAELIFGLTDVRGINAQNSLSWNGAQSAFKSGSGTAGVFESGMHVPLDLTAGDSGAGGLSRFSFELDVNGSRSLEFLPIGKQTDVKLSSTWPDPKFEGAFLPDTSTVTAKGFDAEWKVLHFNRDIPERWANQRNYFSLRAADYGYDEYSDNLRYGADQFGGGQNEDYRFGVSLFQASDGYTKTERSIKYAILFIGLTFLIFFFLELLNGSGIHPLQYVLIGFALCIFYVLLLSFSEYMRFGLAYLISAVMTIGLISWYAASVLKQRRMAIFVGGCLSLLYGFLFTIIQLEDYALLAGSLGLFFILATVMYYSRKIDWGGGKAGGVPSA